MRSDPHAHDLTILGASISDEKFVVWLECSICEQQFVAVDPERELTMTVVTVVRP